MSHWSTTYRIEYIVGDETWDCPRLCWPPFSVLNNAEFLGYFYDLEKALSLLRELREKCPTYGLLRDLLSAAPNDPRCDPDSSIQYRLTKCVETREVLDEPKIKLEQRRLEPYKCDLCGRSDCDGHYGEGWQ